MLSDDKTGIIKEKCEKVDLSLPCEDTTRRQLVCKPGGSAGLAELAKLAERASTLILDF